MTNSPVKWRVLGIAVAVITATAAGYVLIHLSAVISVDFYYGSGGQNLDAGPWFVCVMIFAAVLGPPFLCGLIAALFDRTRRMLQAIVAGCLLHLVTSGIAILNNRDAFSLTWAEVMSLLLTIGVSLVGGTFAGGTTNNSVAPPETADPLTEE